MVVGEGMRRADGSALKEISLQWEAEAFAAVGEGMRRADRSALKDNLLNCIICAEEACEDTEGWLLLQWVHSITL